MRAPTRLAAGSCPELGGVPSLLAPAPTSLPAGTGWGASSSLWHRRGWHHPQPVPTPGAGDTPGGHSTGGSQTHPQPSPSLCPMAFVTPEVSPRSGSVGEAECAAGMLPSHKALRRPAASPGASHTIVPPTATSRSHLLPRRHKKLLFPPKTWLRRRGGWHTSSRGLGSAL